MVNRHCTMDDCVISTDPARLDAHGLYEQFGFARWELMRRPPGTQRAVDPDTRPDPTAG